MNKRQLYESIMKNVAKQVKKALNEDILRDNAKEYENNENYDFYVDMYRYLSFILKNLMKINQNPVLIKNLNISGEIPYNHQHVGQMFSFGYITGLAVEEALINCLTTYINGYNDEDDVADIIDIIGHQGLDIKENIKIILGHDNMLKQDFSIDYYGKTYKIQIKAVKTVNEGVNEMNAAIRNGVDLAIAVVYDILDNNDIIINSLQIYVPDVDNTYNYITKVKCGKRTLSLNKDKSFITIGPRVINKKSIR